MKTARPLTVTVDGRVVFDEPQRGIGKVTVALYRALAVARPEWKFRAVYQDGANPNPFADLPNVSAVRLKMKGDRFQLWQRIRLPLSNLFSAGDIFHTPAGPAPWPIFARHVATIHDTIPLDYVRDDRPARTWAYRVKRAARSARVVLTASEHARERLVHHCGIPASKIEIVGWAAISGAAVAPTPDEFAALLAKHQLPPGLRHVLHFGMADPRKNTANLIRAWGLLPPEARAGTRLLVVGVKPSDQPPFLKQAEESGVSDSVRILGFLPEEEVKAFLASATVMAYPTEYEGFGLPLLDGFTAGVPVLSGNRTSLPEVAGDAAELVDPTDPRAIATGLAKLLGDADWRSELVRRGHVRRQLYTWERTAEQFAEVFERVARR